MNYFNYAIKCIIRNIIYKLMKPKNLVIIVVSVIIIFLLSNYTSVFGYTGNNDYTDKNNTIIVTYNSVCNDLVYRLRNVSRDNNIFTYFNSSSYGYYCYYGEADGRSMTSQTTLNPEVLHIIFYSNTNRTLTISSVDDSYQGMTTTIYTMGNIEEHYVFNGSSFVDGNPPSSVAIPGVLVSYRSSAINSFLTDNSFSNTQDIVGAINQQTNTINQQTEVIQETQDFITDDSIDSSEMSVDSDYSVDNAGVDNFFTTFLNNIYNTYDSINTGVVTISIPLPNNMDSIVLRSDLLSRYIVNTPIYSLIQVFWTFLFGSYLVMFIKRIIEWLSTGKVVEEGVFSFAEWMDIHNEIIKAYML